MKEKMILLIMFLYLLLLSPHHNIHHHPTAAAAKDTTSTYIVHLNITAEKSTADLRVLYSPFIPENARVQYLYKHVITGFAAILSRHQLDEIRNKSGFMYARPTNKMQMHTTRSAHFLGLDPNLGKWPGQTIFGSGIVIGVLDSGITPAHPSFFDTNIPPPPPTWNGHCDFDLCNNKLIGARNFLDSSPPLDNDGHGTHTASTAAGNFVPDANLYGQANGTASGLAPLAHISVYKVCEELCDDGAVLAALDAAIDDGVDVVSISIGGGDPKLYKDSIAIGSFAAMKRGILVSCSAGNGGPMPSTVENVAPWILTVGASTNDRNIVAVTRLGNGEEIQGQSVGNREDYPSVLPLPLIYAGGLDEGAEFCEPGTLDKFDLRGKIVLCVVESNPTEIVRGLKEAGAAAIILTSSGDFGYTTLVYALPLPYIYVSSFDGNKIKSYTSTNTNTASTATIKLIGTSFIEKNAPAVAAFSSRGPNPTSPGILKPDIMGPGVNILAAWNDSVEEDNRRRKRQTPFYIDSGTSMSCPHLSGVAALIKKVHPHWSPAMIKSAIMTTATRINRNGQSIIDQHQNLPADLFATGAGLVNPANALEPGLVYDISTADYISYLCHLYNDDHKKVELIAGEKVDDCLGLGKPEAQLNYPAFVIDQLESGTSLVFSRTVTNVGQPSSTYRLLIEITDPRLNITVDPSELVFTQINENATYTVRFSSTQATTNHSATSYIQGYITWFSAHHYNVTIPISVKLVG